MKVYELRLMHVHPDIEKVKEWRFIVSEDSKCKFIPSSNDIKKAVLEHIKNDTET